MSGVPLRDRMIAVARRTGTSPSSLLMPMAFASLVGGQSFPCFVHNENIGPGHRVSHRQHRIFFQN